MIQTRLTLALVSTWVSQCQNLIATYKQHTKDKSREIQTCCGEEMLI